jgi:uncharacterized protein (DUF1778 family)
MAAPARHREASASSETINLRASAEQKALIDRAAARLGKTRTEFMLDSARQAAENALLDQRLFLLSDADFQAFAASLDAPAEPPEALRAMLAAKSPWEKPGSRRSPRK